MKHHLAALVVALVATLAAPGSNRAEAQGLTPFGAPVVVSSPALPGSTFGGAITFDQGFTFPYSYYAAFPNRARQYVPYGPNDVFPFYGTPYGQPYDRWTWDAMSGPPNALQRYYYPPVR
ncbi:hypothetical protein [Tautonia rosea]|uniref:hypothetical protein n=1 Tax=Tautonia rosea TaxID=2728037 RepID=UPI0014741653|nr:hypothetical protein [Tautonia rosea]